MIDSLLNKFSSRNEFEYFFRFTKLADNFEKLWRMKSLARESLREWLVANDVEQTISENTANACSELIENSIKYGLQDEESLVLIGIKKPLITIETLNKSTVEQKNLLGDFINEVTHSEKKIAELYLEKVQKAILSNESQLGLVKIMMETEGTVELVAHDEENIAHVKIEIKIK